jgi:two-component system, LuxR family, sensor kinase FixL
VYQSTVEKKSISVLLVDDDEDEYLLLRDMMRRNTHTPALARLRIDWVNSYHAALPALATGNYEVALVDYHLGEQTGLDLLRVINQREPRVPVILLTGQGSYAIDMAAMQEGASDYLLKGEFDAVLLERTVRYAIERRRSEEELTLRVHERDLLLERLSIEQNRLQAVIANAASGIVVANSSGQVVLANPIAEQLLGSALVYGHPLELAPVNNQPGQQITSWRVPRSTAKPTTTSRSSCSRPGWTGVTCWLRQPPSAMRTAAAAGP